MNRRDRLFGAAFGLALAAALPAGGQGVGGIPFGAGVEHDPSLPVEITSDSLSVDQTAGTAVFRGSVVVGQGELRLAAEEVEVQYAEGSAQGGGAVERIRARGEVTVTNGAEAAEAQEAVYQVAAGTIEMTGDVVLTQGQNAISGERLAIDLEGGVANIEGRVQTIVLPRAAGAGEQAQ
jgi:lipopolysaccharide export system protein LptA